MPIYVYASCKNYSRSVSRDVVIQEVGRVLMLPFRPHIMLLVTSSIDKNARITASRAGFIVVEVGFKVTKENFDRAYRVLRAKLNPIFKK